MGEKERLSLLFPCQLSQQCPSHWQPCWNRILVTLSIEKTYCCNFRVTLSCWVHLFGGLYREKKTLQGAEVQCVVTCILNTITECKWPRVEGSVVDCSREKGAASLQVVLRRLSLHFPFLSLPSGGDCCIYWGGGRVSSCFLPLPHKKKLPESPRGTEIECCVKVVTFGLNERMLKHMQAKQASAYLLSQLLGRW